MFKIRESNSFKGCAGQWIQKAIEQLVCPFRMAHFHSQQVITIASAWTFFTTAKIISLSRQSDVQFNKSACSSPGEPYRVSLSYREEYLLHTKRQLTEGD